MKILVPPGIGDSYWVMVKLRAFLHKHRVETAEVWVEDNGPRRTIEFIESVPFVTAGGYAKIPPEYKSTFHQAYRTDGPTQFNNIPGFDWFISYNGVLGAGRSLADVDPDLACEWYLPLSISERSREYQQKMMADGPYVAVYLPDGGFYHLWWSKFGPARTEAVLTELHRIYGRIVFFGAEWDKRGWGWALAESGQTAYDWTNLVGQTDYAQLVGLLRGATAVLGYPSGSTILPMVWCVPTVLLWSKYFPGAFWYNVVPPASPYSALDVDGLTVDMVVATVCSLVEAQHARRANSPPDVHRRDAQDPVPH